jgi:hypothetical protein
MTDAVILSPKYKIVKYINVVYQNLIKGFCFLFLNDILNKTGGIIFYQPELI